MAVKVLEVATSRDIQLFNRFPRNIYRGFYMPPVFPLRRNTCPNPDPLFYRVEAQPFLAVRNGCVAGRLVACVNGALAGQTGYFGYYESINDPMVAAELLKAAAGWLVARGRDCIIGPVDLSPHERLGMLVDGFQGYHMPGMPYNPPYYGALMEECGLISEMDLLAYRYDLRRPLPDKLCRIAERARRSGVLQLRSINFEALDAEGALFSEIHNESMKEVWGYVPLAPQEGAAILGKLKQVCDPDLLLLAEVSGEPAAMCLILSLSGRRPFTLAAGSVARLAILAVLPEYRFKGLEAALIMEGARRAAAKGVYNIEISQVAQSNNMMIKILYGLGLTKENRIYRIYRIKWE